MEKQNILLNMRGLYGENGDKASLEFFTEGTLSQENGAFVIEYVEGPLDNKDELKVKVSSDGEIVRLQCDGDLTTDFVFAQSRSFLTAYDTPEGLLEISIMPTRVVSELTPEHGTIDLAYVIKIGAESAYNELSIDYRISNDELGIRN